jgi:hypothetical protein
MPDQPPPTIPLDPPEPQPSPIPLDPPESDPPPPGAHGHATPAHGPLHVEKLEGRQESGRDAQDEAEEDEDTD